MKKLSLFLFLNSNAFMGIAQKLVPVLNENMTVNSETNLSGMSRNVTDAKLPAGSIGYIYRVSVFPKSGGSVTQSLLDILSAIPIKEIQIGSSISKDIIANSNNRAIDFYTFSDYYAQNAFKNSQNFTYCKWFERRQSISRYTDECMNTTVYFGFKNTNPTVGVNVVFEVVALVGETEELIRDNSQNNTSSGSTSGSVLSYQYRITNETDVQIDFQLMANIFDTKYNFYLYAGNHETYTYDKSEMVFLLKTKKQGKVMYTIYPNIDYFIRWNETKKKWDLFTE